MIALENRADVRAAAAQWERGFRTGADVIGSMTGSKVFWHERLGIWGMFGETHGKGGIRRSWNPFGQKPYSFRSNMIVEINTPPVGIDQNIQGLFARDARGVRWVLHQGRMSISKSRITEADFIEATGLKPTKVTFSDGSVGNYHKVAPIDAPPAVLQEKIAAFVAQCARARMAKRAPRDLLSKLARAQDWERKLSPESTGIYEIAARDAVQGRRRHGEVWRALAAELAKRNVEHSNDRVSQYGPDLFTYGQGPRVLFEIKSKANARDIFEAVGQLHIYELLLGDRYKKVLVIPEGMKSTLSGPVDALKIATLEYRYVGRRIEFDTKSLSACLK
jgi:hypothetical protein